MGCLLMIKSNNYSNKHFTLLTQALSKYLIGFVFVSCLLFIPANSFKYYYAWLFLGLLFIPMFVLGTILMIKNPELLRKRLNAKEKEPEQKKVVFFSALMFIVGFIVAGLNFRFNWFNIPNIVVAISSVIFLIFYVLYAEVMRENSSLSRTIGVDKDQKVVDTGLYGIVRHPMYAVTIVLFLMIPLILNSIYSFVIFLVYPLIIIKRINNEEKVLEKDLKGYKEYKNKIKYRLIPYIW